MFLNYEINDETLAVMSFDEDKARIIESDDDYVVNEIPYSIMENSCKYFGSSFEGRVLGSIVEESKDLIFFPTEALSSPSVAWISYKRIKNVEKYGRKTRVIFDNDESVVVNCPYFSIKNQIFRCNMLETISKNRKSGKKND